MNLSDFKLFYEEIGNVKAKEITAKFDRVTTETIASYVAITSFGIVMLIIGRYA